MLRGISPLVSPDLLATLCRMGHGDEIVFADAHFPGESLGPRVIRADGLRVGDLLDGILPLLALDTYVPAPVVMMAPVSGDRLDPRTEARYRESLDRYGPGTPPILRLDRHEFYERARRAFAIVMTGETAKYGNILLVKGVS